jgi:hypothetical protein
MTTDHHMNLLKRINTWLRERGMRARLRNYKPKRQMPPVHIPPTLGEFADQLGEQLRLAKTIADAAAQCDVESYCPCEQLGRFGWYDTSAVHPDAEIGDAVRYLELRQRMVRHPQQRHLVRFPR